MIKIYKTFPIFVRSDMLFNENDPQATKPSLPGQLLKEVTTYTILNPIFLKSGY